MEEVVLCGASAYNKKFYLNEDFKGLPEQIKNELKIMCVLFTEDVGGIFQLVFSETGEVLAKRVMQAGGECAGVDLPPCVFHGLVVLEPDSILFECKAGPYRPVGEGEHAHWAPREGEAGVADYQAWMRAQFD